MGFSLKNEKKWESDGSLAPMEKMITSIPSSLNEFICDGTPEEICLRYAGLKAAAAQADYGKFDSNVVVIDTETTGLSYNHDELIQVAAARVEGGQISDWFVTFVDPGKPIPEEITHLTHITPDMVEGAPTPQQVLLDLVEFCGDAVMVAHNAAFDKTFVTRHPEGYPLLENVWVDSLELARVAFPRLKSHRLLDLVRAFDLPISTHRADDDVASTCAMLRLLLAGVDAMPRPLLKHIAGLATPEEWPTQVVFDYFASRPHPVTGDVAGENTRFSLRQMRRECLGAQVTVEKYDADQLAMDPVLELKFPTEEEVTDAFTATGLVGSLYEQYEERTEQAEMAKAVLDAFAKSENLVVEAGTGVGKSMAYLVPAVLTAKKNNITVGVATKTNALLDQLIFHELPALSEAMGGLTFAPLKGFSHYPCLRRVDKLVSEPAKTVTVSGKEICQATSMAGLLSFIEQTDYDDMDALKIDFRAVPRRAIGTTSHDCLRRKCPFFGTQCFVHGARNRAMSADIVVTNHSLLFCDLVADGGLLPPVRYWVVDEAHGAEAEARRAFSVGLAAEELLRLATQVSADEAYRNPFVRAERTVVAPESSESGTLFYALMAKAKAAGKAFARSSQDFATHMKDLLFFDGNRRSSYEIIELWVNEDIRHSVTFGAVAEFAQLMCDDAERLARVCQDLVAYLEDIDGAAASQREIAVVAIACKEILHAAEVLFTLPSEKYAYSATLNKRKDRQTEKLEALMVNVGETLNETLYARTHSVVFASATVAVDRKFDSFEAAMGLNAGEFSRTQTLCLDSSYDFDNHMTVYVASDMPEPNDPQYLNVLQDLLVDTHLAQRGSMLTLFTNRREMETCFSTVQEALKPEDLRVVCQKWGISVKGLRDEFLSNHQLSLFALKSFWEGFDAPGSTLRGVIIPKLPFAKPTDPLSCERADRDDQAWRNYVLPAAVIETKQAAGRLIRTAEDRGVLILADRRLLTKSYGKVFLNSLPSRTIKVMTCKEIAAEIAANCQANQ